MFSIRYLFKQPNHDITIHILAKECEPVMVQSVFRAAASAVVVIGGLSACGSNNNQSDSKSTNPPVVASCTTDEQWSAVPSYLKASMVAQPLGVSEDAVRNGLLGLADCDKPIKMNSIGSMKNPPIVAIKDRGPKCLAVGTQDDPRSTTTKKIMAVCPGDGTATNKV